MSDTSSWQNRIANYRYSQDDRALSYKYTKEIEPIIDAFLDDIKIKKQVIGTFNTKLEPWRLLAIASFRKYGIKVRESIADPATPDLVTITVIKSRR